MSTLKTLMTIAVMLVAVTAFGQANPSMRADRKISGAVYRSHPAVVHRHYSYQPTYARSYAPAVTTPAPVVAPAPTAVADAGTRTYRSFSFEPTPAPAYVAPAPTTYRAPMYYMAPLPRTWRCR